MASVWPARRFDMKLYPSPYNAGKRNTSMASTDPDKRFFHQGFPIDAYRRFIKVITDE